MRRHIQRVPPARSLVRAVKPSAGSSLQRASVGSISRAPAATPPQALALRRRPGSIRLWRRVRRAYLPRSASSRKSCCPEWFSPWCPSFAVQLYLANARRGASSQPAVDVERCLARRVPTPYAARDGASFQHATNCIGREVSAALGSSLPEPEYYRPNPASKRYVQHLRLWYAQSHPDEDFAETFAVWLKPRSDWRRRYAGWPAIKKLLYVDELMSEIGQSTPPISNRRTVEPLHRLSKTLAEHYNDARRIHDTGDPTSTTETFACLLRSAAASAAGDGSDVFLRRNRDNIRGRSQVGPVISIHSRPSVCEP